MEFMFSQCLCGFPLGFFPPPKNMPLDLIGCGKCDKMEIHPECIPAQRSWDRLGIHPNSDHDKALTEDEYSK